MGLKNGNLRCLEDINHCTCKCGGDMKLSLVWTNDEFYKTNRYLMTCRKCGKKEWFKDKLINNFDLSKNDETFNFTEEE